MVTNTINHIIGKNDFDTKRIKVVFNSKKVTDHHAIIPTVSSMSEDILTLPESELKIYRLISNKLHASMGYPLIENTMKVVADIQGYEFSSKFKTVINDGFTQYLKEYKAKKNEDVVITDIHEHDILKVHGKEIKEKYTTPPKHFSDVIHFESRQWKYSKCKGAG